MMCTGSSSTALPSGRFQHTSGRTVVSKPRGAHCRISRVFVTLLCAFDGVAVLLHACDAAGTSLFTACAQNAWKVPRGSVRARSTGRIFKPAGFARGSHLFSGVARTSQQVEVHPWDALVVQALPSPILAPGFRLRLTGEAVGLAGQVRTREVCGRLLLLCLAGGDAVQCWWRTSLRREHVDDVRTLSQSTAATADARATA